jgi:hypothetical protein
MTLFHLHPDFAAPASERGLTLARASARLAAVLKTIHEGIVATKTRRLQRELMLHNDLGGEALEQPLDQKGIRRLPQRPMILGDKWDF